MTETCRKDTRTDPQDAAISKIEQDLVESMEDALQVDEKEHEEIMMKLERNDVDNDVMEQDIARNRRLSRYSSGRQRTTRAGSTHSRKDRRNSQEKGNDNERECQTELIEEEEEEEPAPIRMGFARMYFESSSFTSSTVIRIDETTTILEVGPITIGCFP